MGSLETTTGSQGSRLDFIQPKVPKIPNISNLLEIDVSNKRFKFGASRNGHIERLGGKEGLQIKQIEVVVIYQVCQELIG